MDFLEPSKINIGNACFELIIKPGFLNTINTAMPRLHCHPSFEVHCIECGTIRMRFENTVRKIDGPVIILIPPKYYHKIESISPDAVKYSFEFSLSMLGTGNSFRTFSEILSNVTAPEIMQVGYQSVDNIRAYDKYPEEIEFMVYSHIGQIILRMFNTLKVKYPESSRIATAKKSSLHKELMVAEIMSYMEENAGHALTLSDITDKFNLSERQIERLLKEVMHDSFFSLLNKYRIRMAVIKITQGETNLSKIAEDCGFSNYVTFWNHFSKLNGMTPSEYQKRYKKRMK